MTTRRTLPLLELDPDLGELIPPDRHAAAITELQVEVHRIAAGSWSADRLAEASPEHVGLLLLEGIVSREVVVADTVSTELLGPGDVVRPWALHDTPRLLQHAVRWSALTEARVAVLDRRFAARLSQWPEVNSVLIDRLNDRAQRLATTQAISQLNRVDRRLLALFWHLAERWGRMTSAGVAVPLTLSHRMLGQLVGARRPTVSTAIAELAKRDELVRRTDGTWLLKGEPVGLPTEETARVVPIRRKLLGHDEADAVSGVAATNGAPAADAGRAEQVISTASDELRASLDRLRTDAAARIARTRDIAEETGALQERLTALREELDVLRRERARHLRRRLGGVTSDEPPPPGRRAAS